MSEIILLNWSTIDVKWSELNFIFSNIYEIVNIFKKGGSSELEQEYIKNNPWKRMSQKIGESKTDAFIKIFCIVNEMKYEDIKKVNSNIKLEVSHFQKVFNEILIEVSNIEKK